MRHPSPAHAEYGCVSNDRLGRSDAQTETALQTLVFIAKMASMKNRKRSSISITLSPAQVDEVVRAASTSRAPGISELLVDALTGRAPSGQAAASRRAGGNRAPLGGHTAIDAVDPRYSRSLLRGLMILTCFGLDDEERGIVELADELGMSPSTTHRYALTLVELGLLERSPQTRKYRLAATSSRRRARAR